MRKMRMHLHKVLRRHLWFLLKTRGVAFLCNPERNHTKLVLLFFSKKMENENEEEEFLRTNIIKHTA
jgi:hypothetical protein